MDGEDKLSPSVSSASGGSGDGIANGIATTIGEILTQKDGASSAHSSSEDVKITEAELDTAKKIHLFLLSLQKNPNLDSLEGGEESETIEEMSMDKIKELLDLQLIDWSDDSPEDRIVLRRLLLDEESHDKRLSEFLRVYNEVFSKRYVARSYVYFKHAMLKVDNFRLMAKKAFLIEQNVTKANEYLIKLHILLKRKTQEFRALLEDQRKKVAEIEVKKLKARQIDKLIKGLEDTESISKLEEKIVQVQQEIKDLTVREAELDETLRSRKVFMTHLCDMVKKLHDDNELEAKDKAAAEIEEEDLFSDFDLE